MEVFQKQQQKVLKKLIERKELLEQKASTQRRCKYLNEINESIDFIKSTNSSNILGYYIVNENEYVNQFYNSNQGEQPFENHEFVKILGVNPFCSKLEYYIYFERVR